MDSTTNFNVQGIPDGNTLDIYRLRLVALDLFVWETIFGLIGNALLRVGTAMRSQKECLSQSCCHQVSTVLSACARYSTGSFLCHAGQPSSHAERS